MSGIQITYKDSDTSASSALAKSMRDTGGSTIYVPGFGNAAVENVKELTVPADPKLSRCGHELLLDRPDDLQIVRYYFCSPACFVHFCSSAKSHFRKQSSCTIA